MFLKIFVLFYTFKIEYDLKKSNFDDLIIKSTSRIEQYGIPLVMVWHPEISKESFLMTFNDQVR